MKDRSQHEIAANEASSEKFAGSAWYLAVETRDNARRTVAAMMIALAVLALLNTAAMTRYVGNFGGSDFAEEALIQAGEWHDLMDRIGLAAPSDMVTKKISDFRELRFWDE